MVRSLSVALQAGNRIDDRMVSKPSCLLPDLAQHRIMKVLVPEGLRGTQMT